MADFYRDEPFVVVADRSPSTKATLGSNAVHLTARVDPRTGWIIGIGALDNLMKGASGMAIQCANLAVGLPETTGLSVRRDVPMSGAVSPLAPESFPDLPPVAGVTTSALAAGLRYQKRADLLLARLAPWNDRCWHVHVVVVPVGTGRLVPTAAHPHCERRPAAGGNGQSTRVQCRERQRLHRKGW